MTPRRPEVTAARTTEALRAIDKLPTRRQEDQLTMLHRLLRLIVDPIVDPIDRKNKTARKHS